MIWRWSGEGHLDVVFVEVQQDLGVFASQLSVCHQLEGTIWEVGLEGYQAIFLPHEH